MGLTRKQLKIIDALQNGGHIWKAGSSFYLARVTGHMNNGQPTFQSENINARTFDAISYMLTKNGNRWDL